MNNNIVRYIFFIILHCTAFCCYAQKSNNMLLLYSPSKKITAQVFIQNNALAYSIQAGKQTIIEPSAMGLDINNIQFGNNINSLQLLKQYTINQTYSVRGNSSKAVNHCNVFEIAAKSNDANFTVQFRVFDNGCAFRYLINRKNNVVKQERTSFKIPASSQVWFFERDNAWKLKSYAGWWKRTIVDSLPIISKQGPIQGKPLVVQLANNTYAVLTEAALYNYSGMRFKAIGNNTLQANFTEETKGFEVKENLVTPWRVVLYANDLSELVNNHVIDNLNPQPDKGLYKNVSYIKEGKSVWSWITRKANYMQPDEEKRFIDAASTVKFEYTMLDEGWETVWPNKWQQLKDICSYAATKHVKVWIWENSKWLLDAKARDLFLDSAVACGIVGVKTDFMNSEAKGFIDFETGFLKATAKRQLMVDFHGCQAPTGESITYPNEMTREGIRGMELNPMNEPIPAWHNAALPFTRFLCGHGDYTPALFSNKGNTTYTHQLALLYLFNSPFQSMAENPITVLTDTMYKPIIPLLQTMPTTWDETIVLQGSEIGKLAAFAKRKGKVWYITVINGTEVNQTFLLQPTFLSNTKSYKTTIITDAANNKGFIKNQGSIKSTDKKAFVLLPTGGLVIKITEVENELR